ncbi:sigma-54-dependent transcriptional regulator [Derxia gummosa]|uniref:Sigma-54-dependent transcriptional regulator n=1 Tax=Derxia gummosa DSM 723 TaxID=1121388 RepID=A0A8B6X5Q4_9BURK|nr:sigma-54 dependent transcriptional regulator [Derxia gummosa]
MTSKTWQPQRVLVVDDEPDLLELLELTLIKMGLDVDSAPTLARARDLLARHAYALCLTDMRLPDGDGIDLVREVAERLPALPIAVLTAFGSAESAVAALKAGAFDYLTKPVALDQLRTTVASALRSPDESAPAASASTGGDVGRWLIGRSPAMARLRELARRLALSMAPVAIHGESGSGKEVVARAIHECSARAAKPFVAVNCGAIPETLMEAEFFGYRKGAFTGADGDREGFFQAARGGTLLLDEVGELPLSMQVKLLRAIQERRIRRLGGNGEEPVDVRIISATHRDLPARVAEGLFRSDLFYRLNVLELKVPPLRERREDLDDLVATLLDRLAERERMAPKRLTPAAMATLRAYDFPGNVRELENILERASALSLGTEIDSLDMAMPARMAGADGTERREPPSAQPQWASPSAPRAPAAAPPASAVSLARDDWPTIRLPSMPGPDGDDGPEDDRTPPVRADFADGLAGADGPAGVFAESGSAAGRVSFPLSLPEHLERIERDIIRQALEETRHNRTAAARLLGLTFRQLRYRMQQLDIG